MSRRRVFTGGGKCARKTISLPAELVDRVGVHLAANGGLTFSAFVSDSIDAQLEALGIKKGG